MLAIELLRIPDYGRAHPASWLAFLDLLRLLPRTLRERRRIQARRTAPPGALRRSLARFPLRAKLCGAVA